MVALRAALGAGTTRREVIVPSYTYIASVSAILWTGLVPVFVDVASDHWHLDPDELESALREREGRVGAVLACSTFGCAPPRMVRSAWEQACRRAGVPLIVDSAAGFGSRDELGQPLGGQGVAEVFSFHATKPLAVGEGGAVLCSDPTLSERIARQTKFGLDAERALADEPGLNAKMSEIHAAAALAALDDFDGVLEARAQRSAAIRMGLAEHGFTFQSGCETSAWQFVPALAPSATIRNDILDAASSARVELRTYHEPLHAMAGLSRHRTLGDLPVTRDLAARTLSVPLANDLTEDEIARVRALLTQPAESAVAPM
jgi:dTDP-4-amino-4,6-dideoxygalactose transaminase